MAKDIKLYKDNSEIVINESILEHFLSLGYKQEKEIKPIEVKSSFKQKQTKQKD